MAVAPNDPRFYLNTYRPLIATRHGRDASLRHSIPPFVDGSIRREPDLEQPSPTISCLCRAGLFAPRLRVGDVVAYMTVKGAERIQRRLPAVLRVAKLFETHGEAADWFRQQGCAVPSNCMVEGNMPIPLSKSLGWRNGGNGSCVSLDCDAWDAGYRQRAAANGRFVVCEALFRDLSWNAPVVHEHHLTAAFGQVPSTQNPPALKREELQRLFDQIGLSVRLCDL